MQTTTNLGLLARALAFVTLTAALAACGGTSDSADSASATATAAVRASTTSADASVASANDSMIVSAAQLVDGAGDRWTVSDGVISQNGSAQTITQKVIVLLYDRGVIYQENVNCMWWSWTSDAWVATTQPPPRAFRHVLRSQWMPVRATPA
jgi:hypothetical protein